MNSFQMDQTLAPWGAAFTPDQTLNGHGLSENILNAKHLTEPHMHIVIPNSNFFPRFFSPVWSPVLTRNVQKGPGLPSSGAADGDAVIEALIFQRHLSYLP